jgi:hypothetical protein
MVVTDQVVVDFDVTSVDVKHGVGEPLTVAVIASLTGRAGIDDKWSANPLDDLAVGVPDDHEVGVDCADTTHFGRMPVNVLGVRRTRAGMGHDQSLAGDLHVDAERVRGEPTDERRVDVRRAAGAIAVGGEQADVMVAEHATGRSLAKDLVVEPEFLDDVAGAKQFVDIAHAVEGTFEAVDVAVNVRHDSDPHQAFLSSSTAADFRQ